MSEEKLQEYIEERDTIVSEVGEFDEEDFVKSGISYEEYNSPNAETISKLIDYVNGIKDLGQKYSLPVLDLYSISGINTQTMNVYTRDNLHLNKNGYKRIAEKMYRFLLNI